METDPPRAPARGTPPNPAATVSEPVGSGAGASPDLRATGALVPVSPTDDARWGPREDGAARGAQQPHGRTWQQELPRWLATLDSGRTRREYEKAVTYFFATPGVPDRLEALTLDLLLAYRGSLALRAERQPTARTSPRPAPAPWGRSRLSSTSSSQLPPGQAADGPEDMPDRDTTAADGDARADSPRAGPLAPATVNLRLTALRQFVAHCSLWGLVPQLSPERARAALRRLAIERRRPYQILAEPEWEEFLEAARAPLEHLQRAPAQEASSPGAAPADSASGEAETRAGEGRAAPASHTTARSPWGTPRAVKTRAMGQSSTTAGSLSGSLTRALPGAEPSATHSAEAPETTVPTVRSAAGLTGARTAQRDYALLALALATGLRAVELSLLDLGDLSRERYADREEWWLVLPDAKTKGQQGGRTLPLAADLVHTLLGYVRSTGREWERAADRATPLFLPLGCGPGRVSRRDGTERAPRRLSLAQIRCIVDRTETQWLAAHGDTAGGSRAISPHALRHSTAIALLEGNTHTSRPPASVEHVRGWLGHVDIRTTQGYLAHLDDRRHHRPFVLQPIKSGRSEDGDEASQMPRNADE